MDIEIQPDDSYEKSTSNCEQDHYRFLAYACWHLPKIYNLDSDERKLIDGIRAGIVDNCEARWIDKDDSRDKKDFTGAMTELAERFCTNFRSQGKVTHQFGGTKWVYAREKFKEFVMLLVERHTNLLKKCYTGHLVVEKDYLQLNSGKHRFDFETYLDLSPKQSGGQSQARDPLADLHNVLNLDPRTYVWFQRGLLEFYTKVRATNYVISANGLHGHPSPATIAAIMTAVIKRKEKSSIIVTTGAALQVNQIKAITESFLKADGTEPPGADKWKDWIEVYYFKDDYCAEISTELFAGSGCGKVDFGQIAQGSDSLEKLYDEFNRRLAYNIPRGIDVANASTFKLLIVRGQDPRLPIEYSAGLFQRADSKGAGMLLKFLNSPYSGAYELSIVGSDQKMFIEHYKPKENPDVRSTPVPIFRIVDSWDKTKWQVLRSDQQGQNFRFSQEITLRPVFVTFERVSRFAPSPGPAPLGSDEPVVFESTIVDEEQAISESAVVDHVGEHTIAVEEQAVSELAAADEEYAVRESVVVDHDEEQTVFEFASARAYAAFDSAIVNEEPQVVSEPIPHSLSVVPGPPENAPHDVSASEPRQELRTSPSPQPFETWWKNKKSTSPSLNDSLRDVIHVALGSLLAQAILFEISSANPGLIIAYIVNSRVDAEDTRLVDGDMPPSVTCALILDSPPTLPDLGFGPVAIDSALATISTEPASLKIDLTTKGPNSVFLSFTFNPVSSLPLYLHGIGYEGDMERLDFASLAASIVGPEVLWTFFSNLPSMLCSTVLGNSEPDSHEPTASKPPFALLVDSRETKIALTPNPFRPEVENAEIAIKLRPESLSMNFNILLRYFNSFHCQPLSTTLSIKPSGESFEMELKFKVEITLDQKKLPFSFSAALNGLEPVVLDFALGEKTGRSPSGILSFFGLDTSLKLPLGDYEPNLNVDVKTIGFTHSQPYPGYHEDLELTSVYFSIGDNPDATEQGLRNDSLSLIEEILPRADISKASTLSDWTLGVTILNPKSSYSVGLQLDFGLTIYPNRSDLRFQVSRWPAQGLNTYRTSISFWVDKSPKNPPTIADILGKLTNQSSEEIVTAIPVLGSILENMILTHGSLAVNGRKVSGFSIGARIPKWELVSEPSVEVQNADLSLEYSGSWWSGRLSTEIVFAKELRAAAEIVLPSNGMTGGIALQNLSDELTFGKLVELVGGGAKLIDVPIMGDEDLASMRLDHAQLEVVRSDSKLSVSGLEIALSWGAKDIGQMKTFGNRLSIGMYEGSSEIPFTSMAGPGTSDLGKTWFVRWEGGIFDTWHLSANLECSTIKTDGDPERVVVLSGSIINPLGAVDPAGLIDTWAGSSSPGLNSLWEQALPGNVNKSFQLQECTVSAAIGSTTKKFACGARATWGGNGQVSSVLLIDQHNPLTSDPKWGFAFALDVRNFRFADLVSDHQLATRIDQVFHINQVSVLAFSNPGNMGLSRIYELLRNVSVSRLLPSESSFLPNDLDETTFDQRITKIQTGDASSNEKPDVVHKAGLAILARFSFSSAKPGSLADNLNAVAQSKLPDVDLMGYFGKITQAQPADGQPAKDQSVVAFKASISPFEPLPSVSMKKIELTYAPSVTSSETITNQFSLSAESAIDFGNNLKWEIGANLVITEQNAILSTKLAQETLELGTLFKLSNIILRIEYNFGSTSDTPSGDKVDKPDDGALPSPTAKPSRLSLTDLSLNGRLTLGSLEADVFVVFESLQPGALMFTAPQEWSISDVFNKIFGGNFPNTLLDIKFSNFIMYYAWKDLKKPSESKDIKLRAESFKKGFHAESDVNLFGIPFSLSIHIHREDKDTQGIEIAGETAPVNVLGLTLHGAKDINKGPEFKFYTAPIKKCSMLTGVALFKQDLGTIDVEYKSDKSRFLGTVGLPESVPILSGVKVNFELAKKGGKNVLRIVGIPAAFKDLLNIDEIFQKVRDLNQDTCGVFVNNLKEFVKTTFHVNLEVPEDHKGLSPETGDEGASELRLYLNPSVEVKIATHSVDTIVFGQIEISVPVPKEFTLDAFANSFWKVLNESVPRILDALLDPRWDNVEKLAKVLTIVAAEKAIADAARKLMCRNNNNEPEDPEDPSQPEEQKPVKETGGGGGLGGLLWIIGGIAAVIIGTGIVLGILGTIYYWLQSRERDEPPNKPADAPPEPPRREDPISKLLRAAVEPEDKFTRWKHCESFSHALEAARDCALNYYTAIRIYEQILGPNGVPTKLGNKAYKFYCHKLEELKYELFTMDTQFGEKWLEIHDGIALTPHPTLDGLMLDVSWTAPGSEDLVGAVVTVTTNGVEQNPTKVVEAKQRMDLVQVPFSEAKSTVTVQVKAFCAIQGNKSDDWGIGDESDYAFFSFGKPVNVTIEIEKIDVPGGRPIYLTRLDADTRPRHQPPFTEVDYFGPLVGQKQHPVLVTGSLTWWPIRYGSSPNELTLLGYDATLRFRRDLILSDVPPGSIKKIRIAIEQMCVEVYDTNENKLATFGLSLFPMAREAD
ncbi:unnamed protein product [Rhizoctonia solani]|uniref:Uncharacterized protein n=1 Tax=Rhizoctonia solani TaxID=456999 RepID=A0A8H3D918_9AGAM|nr:unnamed protein product [Rhizoctonia solani]